MSLGGGSRVRANKRRVRTRAAVLSAVVFAVPLLGPVLAAGPAYGRGHTGSWRGNRALGCHNEHCRALRALVGRVVACGANARRGGLRRHHRALRWRGAGRRRRDHPHRGDHAVGDNHGWAAILLHRSIARLYLADLDWACGDAEHAADAFREGSRDDDAVGQASADERLDLLGELVLDLEVPCAFCHIDHEEQVRDKQGLQHGHP